MSDFQRKFSMESYRRESALKVARRNLKAPLKDFDIAMGYWELHRGRSKGRDIVNKKAALYEEKRIRETERKRRERKVKINGPPAQQIP